MAQTIKKVTDDTATLNFNTAISQMMIFINEYVKHWIWKFAFNNSKPYRDFEIKILQCSLCQTFWCSLIYLIVSHNITLYYIAFALFAAYMTPVFNTLLIFIKEFFAYIFNSLFKWLNMS